ncbi:MAG: hypothetical protein GTO16_03955 [Candidatus Aminicenantes bacterium]|nr:hypothetical protein [Candidatus Aminicenantes bacterium]
MNAFALLIQHFRDMAGGKACSILGAFHLAEDAGLELEKLIKQKQDT